MALRIRSIRLHDFRSYSEATVQDIGDLAVLVGPNAVGKTNLVEAVQLLTALDSFRNPKTEQLISWGASEALVSARMEDGERQLDMSLVLDAHGRRYRLNGKQRPRQELQGILPAVMFTPDDLQLVKGSPDMRRAALDALGTQVSRNYLSVKRDYEKLLRQKNRLLKDEVSPAYLASVNEVLVKIGSQLFLYRLRLLRGLRALLPQLHAQSVGNDDSLALEYVPSFSSEPLTDGDIEGLEADRALVEETMYRVLEARMDEELARKMSLVGPHRDKPLFMLQDRPAGDYASQGQQRSIVIAYKLSELRFIEQSLHEKPVLILDDVMSELDSTRRAALTHAIGEASQTFITTTNLAYFTPEFLENAHVIHMPL